MRKVRAIPHKGKEPYFSFYKMLGFYPDRIELYQEALTHRSSSLRSNSGKWVNNERLEFLGDAILDAIVADILYKKFDNKKEGFLTSTRSRIVQRETLNKIAIEIGIDKIITSSTRNLAHNTNIYGDALEALIGAIYLDQGYRVAKHFVFETLIKQHINIDTVLKSEVDFKSRLIEWGQKYKVEVVFEVTDSSYDEQNNPIFESRVIVGGMDLGSGKGYSKKESHQKAAKKAIKKLRNDNELLEKLKSNLQEVSARGGQLLVFADREAQLSEDEQTQVVNMPSIHPVLAPIFYTIPLQLLSYYVAVLKGTDVDQPRNLAKSVTVE